MIILVYKTINKAQLWALKWTFGLFITITIEARSWRASKHNYFSEASRWNNFKFRNSANLMLCSAIYGDTMSHQSSKKCLTKSWAGCAVFSILHYCPLTTLLAKNNTAILPSYFFIKYIQDRPFRILLCRCPKIIFCFSSRIVDSAFSDDSAWSFTL